MVFNNKEQTFDSYNNIMLINLKYIMMIKRKLSQNVSCYMIPFMYSLKGKIIRTGNPSVVAKDNRDKKCLIEKK